MCTIWSYLAFVNPIILIDIMQCQMPQSVLYRFWGAPSWKFLLAIEGQSCTIVQNKKKNDSGAISS